MKIAVGIDLGGTGIKTAAVDEQGQILSIIEVHTPVDQGASGVLDAMAQTARDAVAQAQLPWIDVQGVGVGVPGFIDFETGIVEEAVNLGWEHVDVAGELRDRLHVPIYLDNDANAAAYGESWVGGGQGYREVLCITLGTGVGGGIVLHDRILHGSNGMAGEIGHMIIDANGRHCNCGNKGCLETVSSATGMVATARDLIAAGETTMMPVLEGITTKVLFEYATQGDRLADQVVTLAMDRLALALANVSVVLNPQVIVIGGGVSRAGEVLLDRVQQSFSRYALPRVLKGTTLRLAELGNEAGVVGTARLVWQN